VADRRNLARWVRCDGDAGCGHEWKEDRAHRRGGPRLYKWCPRCGLRQPFNGYLADLAVPAPAPAPAPERPEAPPPAPAETPRPARVILSTPELLARAMGRGGRG
jgi:hypothetical protein